MRIELDTDIFDHRLGSLYSFTKNGGFTVLKPKIGCSNGLTWNEKTKKFYYIDSVDLDVKEFDWDPKTGQLCKDIWLISLILSSIKLIQLLANERVVIDFRVDGGRPSFVADGMTIDTAGNLYVATFGGSKILKINPT